jgi:RNA-binding protein PNO1
MPEIEVQYKSILIPDHRIKHLKEEWLKIYTPIVKLAKLQIRFNSRSKHVEIKSCEATTDLGYLERSISYIKAIVEGFKPEDAISIMKFRDIFTESFEIQEIRKLKNSHLSRAIGRIIGRDGSIKKSIENFSRCKFVLNDEKVSLLGCEENIKIAKDSIGRLVQGTDPGTIFNKLRLISSKLKDKFGSIETIYDDLRRQL